MFKKAIFYLIVALLTFSAIHFISTRTRLFLSMERALLEGFFFLREPHIHEPNPLVSDEVILLGYDEDALATIGKWPWKRHIHADFLRKIEEFSPRSVLFDILFIKPEAVPRFISKKFKSDEKTRRKVEDAFSEMDSLFAEVLSKYDNVYLDLQLVEQPRPGLTDFYRNRIRFNESIIKNYSQPIQNNKSPVVFHSLEPTLNTFLENAHPAIINVLPDDDGVTRSFPLYYTYRMSDGSYRNVYTIVLSLLQRFYRTGKDNITINRNAVILNRAKTPLLNQKTHQKAIYVQNFAEISAQIKNPKPPKGYNYNENLFRFLVNRIILGSETSEKIPFFPLHILRKNDAVLQILDGWEIYDAAKIVGSKNVEVIFYDERDVEIKTPLTGFFYINYAGKEKSFYLSSETNVPEVFTTLPTVSYKDVYTLEDLPDIPALNSSGAITQSYDTTALEQWFYDYCQEKTLQLYHKVKQYLGDGTKDEEQLLAYMNSHPEEGKYFFYSNFLTNVPKGDVGFDILVDAYPDFGRQVGQDPRYFLTEKQMILSLMNLYREQFQKYYNKFVFTGATARGLGDQQQTPYGTMSGINTIVNAFNTVVTENQLRMSSDISNLNFLLLIGFAILFSFIYGVTSVRLGSLVLFLSTLSIFATGFVLFNHSNFFLETIPLLFSNIIVFMAIIIFKVLTEQKDKKFLKSTFSSYLAPEIIDEMYRTKTMPRLGGEARPITAFFSDIQGFSTFSEKLTARQLVELINEYLSAMTNILIADRGTLDKYEGDAIVAFFGAPMPVSDHALRACRVALAMQDGLTNLRKKWRNEKQQTGEPNRNTQNLSSEEWIPGDKWPKIVHEMKMRVGINTGDIVVGNIGSATRMNYTMMGDPVNLAARLESAGKEYGVYLLVSEFTLNQEIPGDNGDNKRVMDMVEARFIDKIVVVGKSEPVEIYELVAMEGGLSEEEGALFEIFDEGIRHYLRMEWDAALSCFKKSLKMERVAPGNKSPSQIYIHRCESYKKDPPARCAEAWDGVYRLKTK